MRDNAFHDWYRFVLGFDPAVVRQYMGKFGLDDGAVLLDPFCGTGTTLVEAKLRDIESIGVDANPFAVFSSAVKTFWGRDAGGLKVSAELAGRLATGRIATEPEIKTLLPEFHRLLIKGSVSEIPMHKCLVLKKAIGYDPHLLLALCNVLVSDASNLRFGPEVGVGRIKQDVDVVGLWWREVKNMAHDLACVRMGVSATVKQADSRQIGDELERESVDAVITSPPYPNEKDYTRATRLESVFMGFYPHAERVREIKKKFVRSNSKGVYVDDTDHTWVADNERVEDLAVEIDARRIAAGKTSGFERAYSTVVRQYFGGMTRHLDGLKRVLRPGGRVAMVVGDQASYFQVMIRTGAILADIADRLGYDVESVDLHRTRFATHTKQELREEVVVLRRP